MSFPQKLKNNQYIDPKNNQYVLSNNLKGTQYYYIFSWRLIINKEYKLKYNIIDNKTYQCIRANKAEHIYILPFYKECYFHISNITNKKLLKIINHYYSKNHNNETDTINNCI